HPKHNPQTGHFSMENPGHFSVEINSAAINGSLRRNQPFARTLRPRMSTFGNLSENSDAS
ncbi:hypothetical protein LL253_15810, partial [Sphingobium soli]